MIDWFRANLLTINLDKTECLLFNKNNCNSPLNLELELGTHTIKCTDQVKFLGLWIDNKLQWTLHTIPEHIISYVTVISFIKATMGSGQNTPVKMPYVN